ncbi:MAG: hydantoinase B/oxoprolinase family protein [Mesorhizobium sp.]|uniref:hydantoinase B/oxoprolinase family protein n=2 Tax=unclassified Mesorhizobium TaxID=325217 RepID=UPI000FE6AB6A|nr:hydantoinase B/oxoprolinase family protein [Mesorhizobium sp.]RWN85893.1 MAG: hydantoinase B/oxoprolinase family protein [Mesorhizobium sp.]RWO93966.1 MAG: hydantoinase B/oxoprolinase family protein [Mesorhizobium sp.]TIM52131.1 MAG: hydantoinase B/oxoprolinase family protein [Mesorhizobium sp.]
MTFDAVQLALIQKQLDHVSRQMGWVMVKTARSPIFSQSHDFSCFVGSAEGEVVAQADGLPIHTGGAGFALRAVLQRFAGDMVPGDVFILSDPYVAGGNHLPDWTIVRPVFCADTLVAFTCNRAHQCDIGGGAVGSYNPSATEIFHEGIRLPVLKLVEAGVTRRDLWELLLLNSRQPEPMDGDLRAMLGAVAIGAQRLQKLFDELGADRSRLALEAVLAHADRMMREAIARLPDGVYEAEDVSDNDCFEARSVPVKVKLTVRGNKIALDFTGSHPQIKSFKNSSLANTTSAAFVGVMSFLGSAALPRNGGALRALEIIAPEGTVVNARAPAPVTMCTMFPAADIINACWRALAQADPQRASGSWGKCSYCGTSNSDLSQGEFGVAHWFGSSGAGAVFGRDGFNVMSQVVSMGGLALPNVENYEQIYPILVHSYEFRMNSAGAGQFRGGTGATYVVDVMAPGSYNFTGEGVRTPSGLGVNGGHEGSKGDLTIELASGEVVDTPQYGVRDFPPARLTIQSSAGGGWGDPRKRDRAAVQRDLDDGVITLDHARSLYGYTEGSVATF